MATFTVTTTNDSGGGSLRQAVLDANGNVGADEIRFDDAVFDNDAADLIRLTGGQIEITDELTIIGGPAGVTITGDANSDDVTLAGGITDVLASGADRLADNSRIFSAAAALILDGLTLTGGRTRGEREPGGAVRGTTVSLIDSTVSGNSTAGDYSEGGGVSANDVTLTNSTVSGNSTAGYNSLGGGVSGSDVTLIDSTVSRNSTAGGFSGGGGIFGSYDVTLTNSTVSGNSTAGDFFSGGGGIFGSYDVTLTNSTVSGNSTAGAGSRGGGAYGGYGGSVTLTNSILLGNATVFAGVDGDEVEGDLTLTGGNILGGNLFDGDADVGDVTAEAAFAATAEIGPGVLAGVLADNDGPTPTIAIRPDGPAAGTADPATAAAADQRGVAREAPSDLGAFEAPTMPGLVLVGGREGDDLTGGYLADEISGLGGDDVIEAGGGDDRAHGGSGRDRINGAFGDDVLEGGADPDRFIFDANFGTDVIVDFEADPHGDQDKIDLRSLGISAEDFATAVLLEERGEDLLVDVEGGGTVLLRGLRAEGAAALDQSDFLLYEAITFTVTTTADSGAGSLRAAVAAANASAGDDVIAFDAAVFDGGAEDLIRLTSGQIEITDGLTIEAGVAGVTITGDANGDDVTLAGGITDVDATEWESSDDNSRIFSATADLTLDGLTMTGGVGRGDEYGFGFAGGAVRSTAAVTLIRSTVSGNSLSIAEGDGGGVYTSGDLSVRDSTISGNYGGGLSARTIHVADSMIRNNKDAYQGGGLHGLFVTVENSTITGNRASGGMAPASGGGIATWRADERASVRVIDSVVSNNSVYGSGGGIASRGDIYVADSIVSGNSSASNYDRAGGGIAGDIVTVIRSTVSDNKARSAGGGIFGRSAVIIENSTVSGNSAGPYYGAVKGGGVYGSGDVTVIQSTVTGNVILDAASSGAGGGVMGRRVTLQNSIVVGNFADEMADDVVGERNLAGGNIIGGEVFDGTDVIGSATATQVFNTTTEIAPGLFAGVLAENGGPTPTIAIRPDGPAAGAADLATATAADQRGVKRDDAPDLGAFEAEFVPVEGLELVGGPKADVLAGGAGDDSIRGRAGNDTLRGLAGDDLLKGGKGRDEIDGGDGDDSLRGGKGRDRVDGGAGNDECVGGRGRDRIDGELGEDELRGGRGRDRMDGSAGDDMLHGGRGRDIFVFGDAFGSDRIDDFDADPRGGQDRIDLRPLGITAASFAAEAQVAATAEGARIELAGEGSVLLLGLRFNEIDATDFLLT